MPKSWRGKEMICLPADVHTKAEQTYSADTIESARIRGHFRHDGKLYVCKGAGGPGNPVSAVRIIPAAQWKGKTTTYHAMTASLYDKEGHRRPRKHFTYKGILVRCKGEEFVLTDEEEEFYTDETPSHQLSLF